MAPSKFYRFLFVFAVLGVMDVACCVIDSCGDCGERTGAGSSRYRINSYKLSTFAGNSLIAVTQQTVTTEELKMIVDPVSEIIARMDQASYRPLYACSPAPPTSTQNIRVFEITSDADFVLPDRTITKGESLNELFFLTNGPNGSGSLATFLQAPNLEASENDYELTLSKTINQRQLHEFLIKIVLSDNQTFTLQTLPIDLHP